MKLTAESTVLDDKKIGDSFATLQVEADGIRTEVSTKVGNDEVISRINQTAESIKIQADKVNIEGATIFTSGRLSQSSLDGAYDASGSATSAVNGLKTDLSSSSGTTVINGGHIETGTLSAGAVNASSGTFDTANIPNLSANKITTDTIHIERIPATARNDTYITDIGSDGIRVHDSHTSNNSVVINSGGMKVYKGGTADANCIAEYSDSVRIGKPTSTGTGNVLIDDDSVDIRKGSTILATFGVDGLRIGQDGEQRVIVTSDTMAVYDVDGSNPFAVSTEGSLKTAECKWPTWVSGTSGTTYYRSTNIYLRGAVENNRFYVAVSTSGEPTTFTQYIDNPTTTLKTLTVSGVKFGIITIVGGVLLTMTSTTSAKKYASFKWTEKYRETTVKVNDQVLATRAQPATLIDSDGTSSTGSLYTYGNIAMLRLEVYKSNVGNGGVVYSGRLLHHLPVSPVNIITRFGSGFCYGFIGADGSVDLYNYTGATISPTSSSPVTIYSTYIFK